MEKNKKKYQMVSLRRYMIYNYAEFSGKSSKYKMSYSKTSFDTNRKS